MPENQYLATKNNGTEALLSRIEVPESQKIVVQSAAAQIINVTTRTGMIDAEIKRIKTEIAQNPAMMELKEMKRARKELNRIHQDAVSNYNGAMKVVLADVPGETLIEKYKALGM